MQLRDIIISTIATIVGGLIGLIPQVASPTVTCLLFMGLPLSVAVYLPILLWAAIGFALGYVVVQLIHWFEAPIDPPFAQVVTSISALPNESKQQLYDRIYQEYYGNWHSRDLAKQDMPLPEHQALGVKPDYIATYIWEQLPNERELIIGMKRIKFLALARMYEMAQGNEERVLHEATLLYALLVTPIQQLLGGLWLHSDVAKVLDAAVKCNQWLGMPLFTPVIEALTATGYKKKVTRDKHPKYIEGLLHQCDIRAIHIAADAIIGSRRQNVEVVPGAHAGKPPPLTSIDRQLYAYLFGGMVGKYDMTKAEGVLEGAPKCAIHFVWLKSSARQLFGLLKNKPLQKMQELSTRFKEGVQWQKTVVSVREEYDEYDASALSYHANLLLNDVAGYREDDPKSVAKSAASSDSVALVVKAQST